ncbi:transposon Ty3-G Gag-Pol polyprotein [Trichonephila clavipes]|nr:transposon Ty3-G Gag-Pol polyprotein [Trichonephila clavipes]
MKRKENFQWLPKELHQLKYEAISVPQAHHPQTNGKDERVDQSLVTRLKCKHTCYLVSLPYQSPIDQNNYYEAVDEARELALQRTIDYHIKNKIRYDARCIEKQFNPGDLVVYEEFQYPNTRKLSSPFSGPYEIIKQCSEVTYEINKPNSLAKKDSQIVHISIS